jgi:predicted GIY-YIG superfamily endonuclease
MSHRPNNEPTALYRLYDANDVLLYLGISFNPDFRWELHQKDKSWAHLVTRRTVEWYPDRLTALAQEAEATAAEKPLHDSSWRRRQDQEKPEWRDPDGQQSVMDGITSELQQGLLKPGTVLQTGPIGKKFGVARATASHALYKLEQRGLLRFWYHGRYVVQQLASSNGENDTKS